MRQIKDPQFVSSEYLRAPPWMASIAAGSTLEEVLDPSYWANVAQKLHMLDHIECWWEDGTRYVELLVVKASSSDVRCKVLNDIDLRGASATIDLAKELSAYEISYAGPDVGHRIVRKADLVTIHSDSRWTEDDARRWLMDYLSRPNRHDRPVPAAKQAEAAPKQLHGAAAAAKAKADQKKITPPRPPGAPVPEAAAT